MDQRRMPALEWFMDKLPDVTCLLHIATTPGEHWSVQNTLPWEAIIS